MVERGEWHFTPEYSHLQVSQVTWFSRMNSMSKEAHMKQVFSCPVAVASSSTVGTAALEISAQECGITSVAVSVLKDMWAKAERLLTMKDGILKVPWSTDTRARLVMSVSSDHPHVVKTNPRSKKQYICDEKCPMFKGYPIQ